MDRRDGDRGGQPEGTDERAVLDAAARRGIRIDGVAVHRFAPGPPALMLGYGAMTEQSIRRGVEALAAAFADVG